MADAKKTAKTVAAPKSLEELHTEVAAKRADLMESTRSNRAGELVNPRVLRHTRKDIARLETAIRAAELAEQKESK
ncbi:MAG: 50S ribosomal protein L29 [Candidatus Saccharimonas sp.]